jgi:hypothetical protein
MSNLALDDAVMTGFLDVSEAGALFVNTIRDGIAFICNHYNFASEGEFLRELPARYETRHPNTPYDEWERWKGVAMCLVRILLGDFDFARRYRNDDFQTIFPKRDLELDRIILALPELERRYVETGSVV